jgi:hypothetical protein
MSRTAIVILIYHRHKPMNLILTDAFPALKEKIPTVKCIRIVAEN